MVVIATATAVACANVEFNVCQLYIHSHRLRCYASCPFVQPNIVCKFSRLQIPFKNVFLWQMHSDVYYVRDATAKYVCVCTNHRLCRNALSIAIFLKNCNLRPERSYIMWRKFCETCAMCRRQRCVNSIQSSKPKKIVNCTDVIVSPSNDGILTQCTPFGSYWIMYLYVNGFTKIWAKCNRRF